MLLDRSVFLQVCLILTVTQCYSQEYEGSYDAESDDHPDAEDDSGPIDYSKYYAVDTSAPLVSAQGNQGEIGFTSPIEYAGFFDPSIDFGASVKQEVNQPKNPFAAPTNNFGFIANQQQFPDFSASGHFPVDYFEEAQKSQQRENQEEESNTFIPSGPNYISYNLPHRYDGDYSSESRVQPKPAKKQKSKKANYDVESEAAAEYDFQPSSPSGKYADYNTGKSSSTVAQQPKATGYYEKLTQTPTPSPYQKYSFQPVTDESFKPKYLGELISTVAPFNPSYEKKHTPAAASSQFEGQSSENIPAHLKDKNCRRVRKHIPEEDEHSRRKREAMNCFVCEDPASSSKYTQCSYAVEPEPKNDYSGVSERYSTPSKEPEGFRYKRYSGDESVDPYEFIKSRSQKEYIDDEKEYGEYRIPEFYTSDGGVDKSFSEIQSEAVAKNPANCHKEESNGMTCTICKDPKTGGNFEQCSYTSAPKEQKYAYVTEKKYDSDEPEHSSESKPAVQTTEIESSIKSTTEEKKADPSRNFKSSSASPTNKKSEEYKHNDFKPVDLPTIDTSKYSVPKLENYEPTEFKPVTLPSIDTSKYDKLEYFDDSKDEKPSATNDNNEYDKFENFKPAELYKASYHGHDKFKLSEQYNPDTQEDPTAKKEEYKPEDGFQGAQGSPKKLVQDEPYDIPKHFAESTIKEQKTGVRGLEPSLYGSADSAEAEGDDADSSSNSEDYKDVDKEVDEYHFKLFPEFSHEESQQAEVVASNPSSDTTRKDVEEVLAEFTKKDRTACKKAEKNGMTCYLCVDNKGIQHEECMYISESKPQASHVAYHEVKQMKSPKENQPNENLPAESEQKQTVVNTAESIPIMQAAASEEYSTKVKYNPKRKKNVKKVKEQERSASEDTPEETEASSDFDEEPKKETPTEFIVGAEEGAFSAETKPVYSKTLGVKLPKYMIEKSEFEKEFDEFAGIH